MKNLFKTLSFIGLSLSLSMNVSAQASSKKAKSQADSKTTPLTEAKSAYINNQDYLSASSLKDYRNFYGDSLKGFNEAAVKAELLSHLYHGQEFINVMNYHKRDFVNNKYKIGPYAPKSAAPPAAPAHNSKPIGSGGNMVNVLPCVNEDFESTTAANYNNVASPVTGWTVESTTSLGNQLACNIPVSPGWILGSPEFSIVTTPILGHPYIGNIPNSPLGGSNVAVLNDASPGFTVTRISTTFPVTSANTLFQFAYAGSWDGSGHLCCDQPFFTVNMFDCSGLPLACSSVSLTPPGASCQNGATGYSTTAGGISWTNWQLKYIDLTPYVGTCVTIKITNGDCNGGAHHGSLYFDAKCGGSLICSTCGPPSTSVTTIAGPVSYCAGSGVAQISAPTGYATYSWVAPPGSAALTPAQATLQTISISSPVTGATYTVYMTSPSGCQFMSLNTLATTSVNIMGLGSDPSCAGGASGTATVVGNGSGSGYNYSWLNPTNSVVGTSSIVTGLAPGVYSVVITGFGAAGCGSAVATTTVGVAPPGPINIFKPFCGNLAYINAGGGAGYQWYNAQNAAIAGSLGGNSPSLTINNPSTGNVYTLTYTASTGCRDSVRYTLAATNPGFLTATNVSSVCPSGNNGTALLNLLPALGAPSGFNYINVVSTGTTPSFSGGTSSGAATSLSLAGLSAGTYSMNAFDGSCFYSSTFNVHTFSFDFTVSINSPTLCPGNNLPASLSFTYPPFPNQYVYSWSPSTWLIGTSSANSIIIPTVAIGSQSTIVYSVLVTPTVINCPVTKTFTVTSINPAIPTFTPVPNLCNTSIPYQILANPAGGTFNSGITGTNNPLSSGGLISPTLAANGLNSFTYTASQYTCTTRATGTYQVSQFWTSALSSTVPPLCVTNPAFNLMNIVQNTQNGSWTGATPGTVIGGTQFNPAGLNSGSYMVSYNTLSTPNPTVCPSSTTLNILVTKTITPVITQVPEFCTNNALINMTVSPSGGGWLPNTNSAISSLGVVNPTLVPVPSMVATYSVMVGPCVNTNTTTLYASRFYPAGFTGTVNNLCFNSNPVNLMSIVQSSANGTWALSPGVSTNSFFPSSLATGIYSLTYNTISSPHAGLCDDSRTITISVLNPVTPTILPVAPICNNASPLQLTVTPNSGHWTNSPYLSATGIFTPALTSIGNNPVQYIVGTNTCNVQQTIPISIEAFVPATIVGAIPDLCNTSPVLNLGTLAQNNQGIWSGPGVTGTSFNPANTGSGQFTLIYNTASWPGGLCPDQAAVAVNVYSLAAPEITQVGPFCNSSLPLQLQVSPVGGLFGGAIAGAVDLAGKFNPAAAIIGNNIVNYSITSGPCVAYAQTIIKVERMISADFANYAGPFCRSEQAVNMDSYVQNPGGTWYTYQDTPGLAANMFNPTAANPGNTNIIIHQTESETIGLCTDTAAIRIEVRENPVVTAVSSAADGCVPFEVGFSTPSKNSGTGVWTINDGSEPITALATNHIFTLPGTYEIQFNYTDDIGCKALPVKASPVIAHEVPKADFTFPEEIYISEPQIQLTNQTTILSNNTYQWKIGGSATSPTDVNPLVTFPKIGRYQVTLIAVSVNGCRDEVTKTLEVKNIFNVFIPNSFTPNFDGLNDYFMPVFSKEGLDLKTFELEIFDRWGQSLFHTKDATSKGWDGSVQNKGEPLKEEVYVYRIKYKDMDGNAYNKMGHVSLIK